MADDDNSLTSGSESSDQAGEESEPSGGIDGNGAVSLDQGAGGTGETPAKTNPPPDNSTSDDDDSDLIEALTSGNMDAIGDDGEVKKPEKPEPKEAAKKETPSPAEKVDDPAAKKAEETPKEPEKAKDDDQPLTDEEQADLKGAPKRYHEKLSKLFKERRQLQTTADKNKAEVEELAPVKQFTDNFIKHAAEAGLVKVLEGGKIDASGLHDYIEQERVLNGKSPKEIAAYYRGLADDLDPDSVPVTMPQDLKDLVDVGSLKEDEALALARKRDATAKQPELEKRRRAEAEARKASDATASQTKAAEAAKSTGYQEIAKVAKGYHARFGAEWDAIGKTVQAKLEPLLADTHPKAWAKLAETVIEAEVAKVKAPLRKPSTTPAPGSRPAKVSSDVPAEEDDIANLMAGKALS